MPSESSAIRGRRSEIRRRSGGPSAGFGDDHTSSSRPTSSPLARLYRHRKSVPDLLEDDPHRPASADDVSSVFVSRRPSLSAAIEEATGVPGHSIGMRILESRYSEDTRPLDLPESQSERPFPPLPHSADTVCGESKIIGQGTHFASIPLTPRPSRLPRLESHVSQESKASQRSAFSIFPRLPTPDFSVFNRQPLNQSLVAPFSFFRARTRSMSSNLTASSRLSRVQTSSTIDSSVKARGSGRFYASSSPSEQHARHPSRTGSLQSGRSSGRSDILYGDGSYSSSMVKLPLRFTHKFPSPVSMVFGKSTSETDACEGPLALSKWEELGFERIGKWSGYKWCLLLSVITVSNKSMSSNSSLSLTIMV